MIALLSYFIKVSAILALVYLFYALALRRHTFYTVNRYYFLTGVGASFILPCLSLPSFAATNPLIQQATYPISEWDMDMLGQWLQSDFPSARILLSATDLILWIIGLGVLLFLLHFCVKLYSFFRLKNTAHSQTIGKTKIFWVQAALKPFSFWGHIFLNPALHSEHEIAKIVAHEIYHIKQRHTLDLMLGEALVIASWFNPFVWLLRRSMRQNLEYLADRHVLNSGFDIMQYQYVLVRTSMSGMPGLSIAHNFTFSNLKKRIIMMNKKPSTPLALCKYLLILPLFGFAWIGVHAGEIAQTLNEIVLIQQELLFAEPEITSDLSEITTHLPEITPNLPETAFYAPVVAVQDTLKKGSATPKTTVTVISNNDTVKVISGRLMLNGTYISRKDLEQNSGGRTFTMNGKPVCTLSNDVIKVVSVDSITPLPLRIITPRHIENVYGEFTNPHNNPIFILDGKGIPKEEITKIIDPNAINSITVLKGEKATAVYGKKAENGVIIITTKTHREAGESATEAAQKRLNASHAALQKALQEQRTPKETRQLMKEMQKQLKETQKVLKKNRY